MKGQGGEAAYSPILSDLYSLGKTFEKMMFSTENMQGLARQIRDELLEE